MRRATHTLLVVAILGAALSAFAAAPNSYDEVRAALASRDYAKGLKLLQPLVEKNEAEGQFYLAAMCEAGWGVAQDYKEALRLYALAAAQGYARAQVNLGLLYDNGFGVARNYSEAVRAYGLAAAKGDATGQFFLAQHYADGHGVPQDYKEAARLYGLAAAQGDTAARRALTELPGAIAPGPPAPPTQPPVAVKVPERIDFDAAGELLTRKDFDGAINMYSRMLSQGAALQNNSRARALNERAYAYNEKGEYQLALNDLSYALQLVPNYPLALTNRAVSWVLGWQRFDKADDDLKEAKRLAVGDSVMLARVNGLLTQLTSLRGPAPGSAAGNSSGSTNSGSGRTDLLKEYIRTQERVNRENCSRAAAGALVPCY